MEVPKIKGREAGISMEAIGINTNQTVFLTILNDGQEYIPNASSSLIHPPPPQMHSYHVPDV